MEKERGVLRRGTKAGETEVNGRDFVDGGRNIGKQGPARKYEESTPKSRLGRSLCLVLGPGPQSRTETLRRTSVRGVGLTVAVVGES